MNDESLKQQYDDARADRKRLEAKIEAIEARIHDATCAIDFSFRIVDAQAREGKPLPGPAPHRCSRPLRLQA